MRSRVGDSLQVTLVACSVFALSTGAAIRHQQETDEQFVERVKKAIQNDGWSRAKSGIGHALALKPKSAEANFVAAQVYWHEGARSMAIEALETAIGYQPVYPEARLLLAQVLADNNPERAREEVGVAVAQGISGLPAYRLLAQLDLVKGDFNAAIGSIETALRYATSSDDRETTALHEQLSRLRQFIEKLEPFIELEKRQDSPDIVRPVLVNSVAPRYTEEARALKIQGTVGMVLVITECGDVDTVLPYRNLGHGLDEQAMEAARKLKFLPATQSGKPIRYLTKLSIEFNLR